MFATGMKEDELGDGANIEAFAQIREIIDIDACKEYLSAEVLAERLNGGMKVPTRTAPRRPESNQNQPIRLDNRLPVGVIEINHAKAYLATRQHKERRPIAPGEGYRKP